MSVKNTMVTHYTVRLLNLKGCFEEEDLNVLVQNIDGAYAYHQLTHYEKARYN